ncbi:MAG: right-handed parallel beta-helix repeat-containing protein [Candidatus Neomarinimicrobiota bacterium]
MIFTLKKTFFIGLTLAFIPLSIQATNYYVRQTIGNDSNNGLTPVTAWETVTKAANYALQPGDSVFIGPGNYNEQLIPTRSGSAGSPIVYYGDYLGLKTQDAAGIVTIGGYCDGAPYFVPQTASNNYYTFTLEDIIDNGNGTTSIHIRVSNLNSDKLNYIACSLPSGASALSPVNGGTYTGEEGITYTINNPTSNPFYSIKFNSPRNTGIRSGSDDIFIYTLTTEAANSLSAISIQAKASWKIGNVSLPVVYQTPVCNSYSIACQVNNKNNLVFQGITFGNVTDKAIDLFNFANITIKDCTIKDAANYGINASGWGVSGSLIIENDSILCGNTAAVKVHSIYNVPFTLDIENNYIANCGKGIAVEQSPVNNINNNIVLNASSDAIYLSYTYGMAQSVSNNQINSVSNGSGLYLSIAGVQNVDNNQVDGTGSHGIYIYDNITTNVAKIGTVCNNQISNVANYCDGIFLDRTRIDRVANNLVHDIAGNGISTNQVTVYSIGAIDSNLIYNCAASGIYVVQAMPFNSIKGNTVYLVQNGLNITGVQYFDVDDFSDNCVFSYSTNGIYVKYLQNTTLENNLVYQRTGSGSQGYGINIYNDNIWTVNVKNNTIYNAGYYGIYGRYVTGSWRNNIVVGSTYGMRLSGWGAYVIATYNCVHNNQYPYYGITPGIGSITADPLFVDADGADNILGGDNWHDDDLHIKSTGGSYHFGLWLYDDADSPCLDTGDPNDDYSFETEDNGDRINIGCYGNTYQASRRRSNCPMTAVYPNFPNNKWVMIGIPVAPTEGTPPGDPLAIFGDDFGGAMPDGTNWYSIHWVTEDSVMEYYEYGDGTIYQPPTPYPGLGYFVWQNTGAAVNVDVSGCPVDQCQLDVAQAPYVDWASAFGTALGFNQFANPYIFPIDWSNTEVYKYDSSERTDEPEVYTLSEAAAQGWISPYAYTWDHDLNQYNVVVPNAGNHGDSVSVWQGFYFIQIDSVSNLQLNIPHRRVLAKSSPVTNSLAAFGKKYTYRTASVSPDWDWFLKLGVVSTELKLQDIENGIGTAAAAKDGFDGFDALEMRGTDVTGNYLQLKFVKNNAPDCAYDLHAPFDANSTWKMQVKTPSTNLKKSAEIVWPQIRLVPQNLKFSLLAGDNSILVDDLHQISSYKFQLKDTLTTLYVRATKIGDSTPPTFSYVFTSNQLAPNDLTFFIVPSEPLNSVTATVNGKTVNLTPVSSPPNIYYGKHYISETGAIDLAVSGTDVSGNSGAGSATFQAVLAKSATSQKIALSQSGIEIELPAGSLSEDMAVYATRCAMDLSALDQKAPIGDPIYIGPDNVKFTNKATLRLTDPDESKNVALYRLTNGNWELVENCQNSAVQIAASGTYCFFPGTGGDSHTTATPLTYALNDCYPNPFNNTTTIHYSIKEPGRVQLTIYDLRGYEVQRLINNIQPTGTYQIPWDGRNQSGEPVASGIYYLSLKVSSGEKILYRANKKLTLIK